MDIWFWAQVVTKGTEWAIMNINHNGRAHGPSLWVHGLPAWALGTVRVIMRGFNDHCKDKDLSLFQGPLYAHICSHIFWGGQ